MTTRIEARPIFAATLTPNNSLGRNGLRVILVVAAIGAAVPAAIYFSLGAWPIVGFLGAGVLLLGWALAASMRDGRRLEKVTLWPDQLELARVAPGGKEELLRFSPYTVRLVIDRDFNERTTAVHLRTRDGDVEVGTFLNPDDKASFARALGTALRKARQSAQ